MNISVLNSDVNNYNQSILSKNVINQIFSQRLEETGTGPAADGLFGAGWHFIDK
jgi:hypothetical protein